ncbi:EAL domain-containing protein [Massilia arenosa]|uniref:EAL domain-containing protein n=1 Tax=Zemynaea arenosa TaxID=2561931 RepID=A0A4Y9ST28_9BURK|nr:EAL domain-containing protein [Massilia arenosa]TFW27803.1 EAL domain-containing protein [Massilia arenosa]
MPAGPSKSSLSLAAACALGGGLVATVMLFGAVARLEYERTALNFSQRANVRVAAVQHGLQQAVEVVTVTNQLFASVQPVTRQQFHDFTVPLLERYPFISAFNFHRVVPGEQRAAIEAQLRQAVPGTVLREMRNGRLEVAPARSQYNIVDYLEPLAGNEPAFGLNVSPNSRVAAALAASVASGKPAATGLLTLAQDHGGQHHGFEVLMAVYKRGAPLETLDQRRAALLGDTAAIMRPHGLVQRILADANLLTERGVMVDVYASREPDPATLVYNGGPAAQPGPLDRAGTQLAALLHAPDPVAMAGHIDVAGQPWHVVVRQAPTPFLDNHTGSLSTLVGGVLLTLLLTVYVQATVRRSRRVQALVAERTVDLKRSNEALIEDVIARKRTEKALQESEQRFRQLVTMSTDWYWEQDEELRFTYVSSDVATKGGVDSARYLGKTRWEAAPGFLDSDSGRTHKLLLEAHQSFANFEYVVRDDNGTERWFCISGEPLFDELNRFMGYRGTGSDITARKATEQRIHHVAQHDVLTGLPNRSLLQDRLSQAIAYSERSGQPIWVMLIDLDRFKFVNDSMGHKAGDVLLVTVAARLHGALRETDTVARLSGDEFVVILTGHGEERLTPEIVQRLMDSVAQPVMLGTKEFSVTASIGVAVYPTDGAPADALIEHADIAMYRAKKLGRNNFQFYTPAMNDEAQERVRIEGALRKALDRGEFVLHYQPQVDLATGEIVGMEALLRWKHPELGMVPPGRFIGVAEDTGLIAPIGAWVMRTAAQQNKAWQDAGLGQLRVAVNLSARQFASPDLVADIERVLADTGLPPEYLEIELTESLFMSDIAQAVDVLHGMKALGIKLSIDDFGTGYSSLSYLSRFPIDVLKIDRSFVNDIDRDASDAAIVASIITLAHNLKLSVIAEGVESAGQLDYLRRHGCDEMQGFYFSKPLPADEFAALLRARTALALAAPELDEETA